MYNKKLFRCRRVRIYGCGNLKTSATEFALCKSESIPIHILFQKFELALAYVIHLCLFIYSRKGLKVNRDGRILNITTILGERQIRPFSSTQNRSFGQAPPVLPQIPDLP